MGVARIFFGGGETFSKKVSKNIQKIFKNIQKKFKNFFKKFLTFSKNFQTNFFIKMLKIDFLSIFFKKFNKPSIQFLRVWTKNAYSLEILRKFSKFLKRFLKKIAKNALFTLAHSGIISGGREVHQGRACKGVAAWGVPVGGAPGRRRSFQKICKKINEKLQFLKNFKKISRFFQNFL